MCKPLVSIIVPMYNSEKTIEKCIDSILKQTYYNIEIILVDDGSTDNTLNICMDYKSKDSRIEIFTQANKGANSARRAGLKEAKGQYIGFVDSDDWIESNMFEELISCMKRNRCDIVSSGVIREFVQDGYSQEVCDNFEEGLYTDLKKSIYKSMLWDETQKDFGLYCTLWNKLFKKDYLEKVYEEIDTRVFYGEDCLTLFTYMMLANSIYIMKKSFYHYNILPDSMCRKADDRLLTNNLYLFRGLEKAFDGYGELSFELGKQLKRYILQLEIHSLRHLYNISLEVYGKWNFNYPETDEKDVVIYAAGECGIALHKYLTNKMRSKVVAWVDREPKDKEKLCLHEIRQVLDIANIEFDYIVIGVEKELLAMSIKTALIEQYNIPSEKILWRQPKHHSIFDGSF